MFASERYFLPEILCVCRLLIHVLALVETDTPFLRRRLQKNESDQPDDM